MVPRVDLFEGADVVGAVPAHERGAPHGLEGREDDLLLLGDTRANT